MSGMVAHFHRTGGSIIPRLFIQGKTKSDHYEEYIDLISRLIQQTIEDPKNKEKKIDQELWDELEEINRYHRGEVEADYILRYWDSYTMAIS